MQRLNFPDRTGAHFHTAFPLSLALDWARSQNDQDFADLIATKAQQFYLHDCSYPLQIESLVYDFVSPGLAEADLMRRILMPLDFAN